MDLSALDYAEARNRMVDGQIRPNKVTDARLLNAMRALPRERFLPPHLAPLAYIDEDIPLGNGRALMEPMILARLLQEARPRARERALVVGAGTGYGAALLAACGALVTALEEDEALLDIARRVLPSLAPDVVLIRGPLADGLAKGGPWDLILIEGAVPEIPPAFASQLRTDGGRLATVIARPDGICHAVLAEPVPGGLRAQPVFDCATPVLPPLARRPGFVF